MRTVLLQTHPLSAQAEKHWLAVTVYYRPNVLVRYDISFSFFADSIEVAT